jgi:hypothetical protein
MPEIYRHHRLRLPGFELRGLMLFPLIVPLLPALAISLVRGRADQVLGEVLAIAGIGSGAWLIRRALRRERTSPSSSTALERWAGIGSLASASVVCNSVLIGHSAGFTGLSAALVLLGGWLSYAPHGRAGQLSDRHLEPDARRQLSEARAQIAELAQTGHRLPSAPLRERLLRIAAQAGTILDLLAEDPREISTARRFLGVYLDGALSVSQQYERTALQHGVTTLEPRFIDVLDTIERVFDQQHQRLLANDILDLDIQIEVLKSRLDNEGIA